MAGVGASLFVDQKIKQRRVMLFSKTYSPECKIVKAILEDLNLDPKYYEATEIEKRQDCTQIENYFQTLCLTSTRTVPLLFVDLKYIGGYDEILQMHENGTLRNLLLSSILQYTS